MCIGDRVIFLPKDRGIDFIGIIARVNDNQNITTYSIISKDKGRPWEVSRDKILRKIYYPFLNKEDAINTALSLASTYAPTSPLTQQETKEATNLVSNTANWKTYMDEKTDIEFKYPNDWYAKPLPAWTFNIFLDNHPFEIPQQTEFMTPIQINLNEVMNTTTNKKSFQEKTLDEGVKRISSLYDQKSMRINNLTVGGKKAAQISGVWGPGMFEGHYFNETLIQMDNNLLIVSLSNKEFDNIYNQILSTFKFTP